MQRHNGDNIASFHTLYIAKVKNLTSVNFDAQKFTEIYFTPQTGQWQRKTKTSKNGNYFEHNLVFDVPKYREDVETTILDYVRVALIAYIVLTNGEFVRIGSFQSPFFILADLTSGENYADYNSYTFKGTATETVGMTKNIGIIATPPPEPTPIILASGLRFNQNSQYLSIGNQLNSLPTQPNSPLSFCFLFRPLGFPENGNILLSTQDTANTILKGYRFVYDATSVGITLWTNGGSVINFLVNYNFNIGTNYHVVFCKRANLTAYFSINGQIYEAIITLAGGFDITDNTQAYTNSTIGAILYQPAYSFYSHQIIYDAKIYSRTLLNSEINDDYIKNGDILLKPANLFLWYRFNEKTGTVINDSSTNNRHATMINYELQQYNLGIDNYHVNENGNPILN